MVKVNVANAVKIVNECRCGAYMVVTSIPKQLAEKAARDWWKFHKGHGHGPISKVYGNKKQGAKR